MTPEQRVVEAARKWYSVKGEENRRIADDELCNALGALPEPAPNDWLPADLINLGNAAAGPLLDFHGRDSRKVVGRNVAGIVDAALAEAEKRIRESNEGECPRCLAASAIICELREQLAERWKG